MRAHVSLCICVFLKTSVSFPEKRDDFHCNYMNPKACTLCQAVGFHKCLMKEIKKTTFSFRALFIFKNAKSLLLYRKLPSQLIKSYQEWQGIHRNTKVIMPNPCFYTLNRRLTMKKISSTWDKCSLLFSKCWQSTQQAGKFESRQVKSSEFYPFNFRVKEYLDMVCEICNNKPKIIWFSLLFLFELLLNISSPSIFFSK